MKPLADTLFTEQEVNSQIGAALCLAAAIDAASDLDPIRLGQSLLPRLEKLVNWNAFKAKAAGVVVIGTPSSLLSRRSDLYPNPNQEELPASDCESGASEDLNKKILIALIVSSTLLCITVMFLLYLLLWRYRNLKNSFRGIKQNSDCVKSSVSTKPIVHKFETMRKGTIPVYEYQLLESATNKFSDSNVLSRGGRGCLYRACLDEMSSVTVKKLDGGWETDIEKQFETEVDWLAKIRHQNIVSLLGFCVYRHTRFVVCEMMQNETLESQLHGTL